MLDPTELDPPRADRQIDGGGRQINNGGWQIHESTTVAPLPSLSRAASDAMRSRADGVLPAVALRVEDGRSNDSGSDCRDGIPSTTPVEQERPRRCGCRDPVLAGANNGRPGMQEGMSVTVVGIALLGCDSSLSSPS
jgi:hypothetical protein